MQRFGLGPCILHLFTLKGEFNCTYYIYKQVNSSMETNPKQINTYIKTFNEYVFGSCKYTVLF